MAIYKLTLRFERSNGQNWTNGFHILSVAPQETAINVAQYLNTGFPMNSDIACTSVVVSTFEPDGRTAYSANCSGIGTLIYDLENPQACMIVRCNTTDPLGGYSDKWFRHCAGNAEVADFKYTVGARTRMELWFDGLISAVAANDSFLGWVSVENTFKQVTSYGTLLEVHNHQLSRRKANQATS